MFVHLACRTFEKLNCDSKSFKQLEWLTVILYDRISPLFSMNETRKELFYQKNRPMEKLPPTQDALLQRARRVVYQAGIWTTSTQSEQAVPSPQEFSWTKEADSWIPVRETIPEVSRACRELIRRSCKADY